MDKLVKFNSINEEELLEVEGGGVIIGTIIGLTAAPFILGAIAGGSDEYARKKGHH